MRFGKRQHEVAAVQQILDDVASHVERALSKVFLPHLDAIEREEDRWGGEIWRCLMPQPLEAGDKLLVEYRHFIVEDERRASSARIAATMSGNRLV